MDSFYTESGVWKRLYQLAELNRLQQNFAYPDRSNEHQMLVVEVEESSNTESTSPPSVVVDDDVVDDDQKSNIIVGFCDIDARPLPIDCKVQLPRPYLSDLCVAINYRRQGLAKALVDQAERFCMETLDSDVLWIRVQEANHAALSMYQQLGYNIVSKEVDSTSKQTVENKEMIYTLRKDLG